MMPFDPNDIKFPCVKYANTMGESFEFRAHRSSRSGDATICILQIT